MNLFKNFGFLRTSQGASITGVMVAIGIAGILAAIVMNLFGNTNKMARNAELVSNYTLAKSSASTLLNNAEACKSTLSQLTFPDLGDPSPGWQDIELRNQANKIILKTGMKKAGLLYEKVEANTGISNDGYFTVEFRIKAIKRVGPASSSTGHKIYQDSLFANAFVQNNQIARCVYQANDAWSLIATNPVTIYASDDNDHILAISSGYNVPQTTGNDERHVATNDPLEAMPFEYSQSIEAVGNQWLISLSGDAQGFSTSPGLYMCAWLTVAVWDTSTSPHTPVLSHEAIGFSCNSWTRPSRSDIAVSNLVVGRTYRITAELHRVIPPGSSVVGYVATQGVVGTVKQFIAGAH